MALSKTGHDRPLIGDPEDLKQLCFHLAEHMPGHNPRIIPETFEAQTLDFRRVFVKTP